MVVYDAYGARLTLGKEVARGSAATLYEIPSMGGLLAKIYHSYQEEYEAKLRWMMAHPPVITENTEGQVSIAWPRFLLYNAKASFLGYAMPYQKGAAPLVEALMSPNKRSHEMVALSSPVLHQLGYQLAAAIRSLHTAGYVAGSLHGNNILVTPSGWITLIDTDSFQVQTQHIAEVVWYPCPTAKAAYLPPELQGRNIQEVIQAPEQDRFSLAVLIFQLLMQGHHPFHARWHGSGWLPPLEERMAAGLYPYAVTPHPSVTPPYNAPPLTWLHPRLAALFERCFVDGHQATWQRPWPIDWEEALQEAEQALLECPAGHHYGKHLPMCPFCAIHPATSSKPNPRKKGQNRATAAAAATVASAASLRPGAGSFFYDMLFPGMRGAVLHWWPPSLQTLQLLWALMAPVVLVLMPCILFSILEAICRGL